MSKSILFYVLSKFCIERFAHICLFFLLSSGEGRPEMRHDAETKLRLLKHIFFSHVFARTYVAKPHNAGLFPYDINYVSNCHLDWIGFALKHLYCLFSPRVMTNFGRIKVCDAFVGDKYCEMIYFGGCTARI